ncbi:PPE family protein [[Mycobacterium] nativiensis]|uniref:PPE family protein n=1 Tax=[Mycobacterium] nativiensis TaxID=2855503 RepID=A0ABU5XU99_9MYCO|nr:PPE family protein [Mycolicibacter sp. MYC340]MEB3031559.1 PPE family protein [Mycolicibacter sp. MYC340]
MLDYGALPPEVNSTRMYTGPGSAPMMAAAAAWRTMAAELTSAAHSYETVIAQLSGEEWLGPGSAAMASAAAPYVAWMSATAAQAEQAASQATAAAAAFETARAATVPPAAVTTNRVQQAALVSTNVLGINTAAIAALDAHYAQMWAQDAAAMYGYASGSAAASQVTPFSEPTQTTNPAGVEGQQAAVAQAAGTAAGSNADVAQMISSMPSAIQGLSSPLATGTAGSAAAGGDLLSAILNSASMNGFVFLAMQPGMSALNSAATAAAYIPSTLLPNMVGYFAGGGFNAVGGGTAGAGIGALLAPGGPLSSLGALGGGGLGAIGAASGVSWSAPAVSAGLGQASLVGTSLSVPPGWSGSIPAAPASATALQASSFAPAPESSSMAAMPPGMAGGRPGSFGYGTPRYGFKPTVMPRPVIAG